jgi:hypothetical protein
MRAGKVDGIDDVGNSGTLNDQCRVFVDERVVVLSGHIVVRITSTQYPATQTTYKFLDDHVIQVRCFNQLHDRGSFPALAIPLLVQQCTKVVASQQRVPRSPSRKPLKAVSIQPIGLRTCRSPTSISAPLPPWPTSGPFERRKIDYSHGEAHAAYGLGFRDRSSF